VLLPALGQLDSQRDIRDLCVDVFALKKRGKHLGRGLHVRDDAPAMIRFQERSHDGEVRGPGNVQVPGGAVVDKGEKKCRRIFDFQEPGVLPVRMGNAGNENRAPRIGEQELGLEVAGSEKVQDRQQPGASAAEPEIQGQKGSNGSQADADAATRSRTDEGKKWPENSAHLGDKLAQTSRT